MNVILIALVMAGLQGEAQSAGGARAELQGVYDEIGQATMQFSTPNDVEVLHSVFYAPEWVFIDTAGGRHAWSEMREGALQALAARPESIVQPIRKLTPTAEGATVLVKVTTVRKIVDETGRYGPRGGAHTTTETATFRDVWTKTDDGWRERSREQVGPLKIVVDGSPLEGLDENPDF